MLQLRRTAIITTMLAVSVCLFPGNVQGDSYRGWRWMSVFQSSDQKRVDLTEQQRQDVAAKKAAEQERKELARQKKNKSFRRVGHILLWYFPNRIMDLLDCFTLELNAGNIGLDLYLTRFAEFGAGVGLSCNAGWSIHRQFGIYTERDWHFDFLKENFCETSRQTLVGSYIPVFQLHQGALTTDEILNNPSDDPYAIGVKAGFYLGCKVQLHPVEFADFLAGIFVFDPSGDDY